MIRFKKFKGHYKINRKKIHHFKSNNKKKFNNNTFKYIYIKYRIKWEFLTTDNQQ